MKSTPSEIKAWKLLSIVKQCYEKLHSKLENDETTWSICESFLNPNNEILKNDNKFLSKRLKRNLKKMETGREFDLKDSDSNEETESDSSTSDEDEDEDEDEREVSRNEGEGSGERRSEERNEERRSEERERRSRERSEERNEEREGRRSEEREGRRSGERRSVGRSVERRNVERSEGRNEKREGRMQHILNYESMSIITPENLLYRVFFRMAIIFACRGGEHYHIKADQLQRREDKGINRDNAQIIPILADYLGTFGPCYDFQLYLSKRPIGSDENLYLQVNPEW
ncbi:hypothetical protein Glove_463g2 [Diversispora epigaea]|uniref:Uncharacterized protein n=1 Tax=Diversispora epigaea TaxID=1348612 RepID=A0A397GRV9_9GLOM|nr:hypothetical protein Glove_463g2 [Diversispora epigaea]